MKSLALSFSLISLLFGSRLLAQSATDIEVTLKRVNNFNVGQTDRFILSKTNLRYNKKNLRSKKALELAQEIISFQEVRSEKTNCPAGLYSLMKKSGATETKIEGCAQGKDYAKLLEKFYTLLVMTRDPNNAP